MGKNINKYKYYKKQNELIEKNNEEEIISNNNKVINKNNTYNAYKENNLKSNAGITIITLAIMILIIIILASITINAVLGDNGLLKQAQATKDMAENSVENYGDKMQGVLDEYTNIMSEPPEPELKQVSITVMEGLSLNLVESTNDGGHIAVGSFSSDSIQVGNVTLNSVGSSNRMIIKYSNTGEATWGLVIGGNSSINSIVETPDGGYVVGGQFIGSIQVGDNTLTSNGDYDGFIIKISSTGSVLWTKAIGGTSLDNIHSLDITSTGAIIIVGFFSNSFNIDGIDIEYDNMYSQSLGMLIELDNEGTANWAQVVEQLYPDNPSGYNSTDIEDVTVLEDNSIIVGIYFFGEIQLGDKTLVDSIGTSQRKGAIAQISSEGQVNWLKATSYPVWKVEKTRDGGFIVAEAIAQDTNYIVKYNNGGEQEWDQEIRGEYYYGTSTQKIIQAADGGYIGVGYFEDDSLQLGEYVLTREENNTQGFIYKLTSTGEIEWAAIIDGMTYVYGVAEKNNGELVICGEFSNSTAIQMGKYQILENAQTGLMSTKFEKIN